MDDQELMNQLLEWIRSRYFGKYRGTVSDNQDKTERGRLKVKVPAVLGDLEVWAMPCVPYAGKKVGFYSLPETGVGVWVEFEGGDPSFPIWTGCFWGDKELPDKSDANLKVWKTGGLTLRIDDDKKELQVKATDGAKVTVNDSVVSERDQAKHTVSSDGVKSERGSKSAEVTQSSFTVNGGALEVT